MITRSIPYRDRDGAWVSVARIEEPYGEGSEPVVTIGSTLKGKPNEPTWVVHVPANLVPRVCAAMLNSLSDAAHIAERRIAWSYKSEEE